MRLGPTMAAIAKGDTKCVLYAYAAGSTAVCFALLAALQGMPLSWVAAAAFLGECLALATSVHVLATRHDIRATMIYRPATLVFVGIGLSAAALIQAGGQLSLAVSVLAFSLWVCASAATLHVWEPEFLARLRATRAASRGDVRTITE